ncbi:MAG: hypothetical protein WAU60_09450 [Candidatus Competibacter denitrificans]|jgi:hypothetical protein
MVREFKKTGVAAALTGALLATASMSSQATVQLSAPGDVVLVPYVVCDTTKSVNTMVGLITFYKERLGLAAGTAAAPAYWPAPLGLASGNSLVSSASLPSVTRGTTTRVLHWYFYNSRSEHLLDGIIPVTDNDFVRFDWCSTLRSLNKLTDYGQGKTPGYMIFTDNVVDRAPAGAFVIPSFALYGHSYQIAGNWATQAFIPVIANPSHTYVGPATPTYDSANFISNVTKRNGYPAFRRLVAGTDYTDIVSTAGSTGLRQRDVYMRYYLDPTLARSNSMVFWFNANDDARKSVAGETYDSEQNYLASFSYPLPDELNVVTSTPTAPAFPGMIHTEKETYGDKFDVVNTGIVRFGVPEFKSSVSFSSSGVSFNMLGLAPAGTDSVQIQTEMATEGQDYFLF